MGQSNQLHLLGQWLQLALYRLLVPWLQLAQEQYYLHLLVQLGQLLLRVL
jgi:hypothetical protein